MRGSDLFELYRQLLAVIGGSYATVRLVNFVWRFQLATRSAPRLEAMARRYLVLQVLRVRISRFALDLLHIALLVLVLGWLIRLHWH
ncbi:MAG TPA: hypothetical protein VM243_00190 [Phycisphaerae bacterium]|nr:hypothetical protein [Phycisphaerae bacterium]